MTADPIEITPEIADARQFEERLERGLKEGAFLVLLADKRSYLQAGTELQRRFPIEVVDVEEVFLEALRCAASAAKVDWQRVL